LRMTALWLAVAGRAGASMDALSSVPFDSLDTDGDGFVSLREFTASVRHSAEWQVVAASSIFAQADVDDDGRLGVSELEFAEFLATADEQRAWLSIMEAKLPAGLAADMAELFGELRRSAVTGRTPLGRLSDATSPVLGQVGYGSDASDIVAQLFYRSDITKDGALNLNELDYFHLLFCEAVLAAAHDSSSDGASPHIAALIDSVFQDLDLNRDGKLDEDEAAHILAYYFADADGGLDRSSAHEHFAAADADGDRLLDKEEAGELVERLMDLTGL